MIMEELDIRVFGSYDFEFGEDGNRTERLRQHDGTLVVLRIGNTYAVSVFFPGMKEIKVIFDSYNFNHHESCRALRFSCSETVLLWLNLDDLLALLTTFSSMNVLRALAGGSFERLMYDFHTREIAYSADLDSMGYFARPYELKSKNGRRLPDELAKTLFIHGYDNYRD